MKVRRGRKAVSVVFVASIASAGVVLMTHPVAEAAPPTLTIPGRVYPLAGQIQKCRSEVAVDPNRIGDAAGPDPCRPAHQERHAQRLFIHEPLVVHSVLAQEKALVARVDHHRVFPEPVRIYIGRRD